MGPANTGRVISQEAFDEVVKENMEDLGMEPVEALEDAIQTLTLQGVDLSGLLLTFRLCPQKIEKKIFYCFLTFFWMLPYSFIKLEVPKISL